MLTLSSPFYNKTEDQRLNLVKVIQLVSGWTEAESRISLIPSPAVLHCLPLSTHSLKQLAIFIHHRKGGNYAWPKANLTPPLSQLSGKNRQSWPSTPCPSNISTVSCFLKPKLSWVKHGLDLPSPLTSSVPTKAHLLPLRTREGQWGGRSQASPTGESLGPWVRKKKRERHSFKNSHEFWSQDIPSLKTARRGRGGGSRRPYIHLCSLKSEHTCRKTERRLQQCNTE